MNPSIKRLPPKAVELFHRIHQSHLHGGNNLLVTERQTWFEFLRAMHEGNDLRLTGRELYELLTEKFSWRNDLAQSLVAEYEFAMEFMDFLAPPGH